MINNKPLISIIVPTKKAGGTILRCLLSIQGQTFDDFECVNVDFHIEGDSNFENTKSIRKDPRFIYLKSPKAGLAFQRNYGVQHSKGEYIVFVDGDDTIEPTYLEIMYKAITEENVDIVCCDYKRICGENKYVLTKHIFERKLISGVNACKLQIKGKETIPLTLCQCKLAPKKLYLDFPINEEYLNEDQATSYIHYFNSKKVLLINQQLYNYYVTPNSLSQNHLLRLKLQAFQLIEIYENKYLLYKTSKDKELIFDSYYFLLDNALAYGYKFKKTKDRDSCKMCMNYYRKYFRFFYSLKSPFSCFMLLAKYLRVIL